MLTKSEKVEKIKESFKKAKLDATILGETIGLSASSITPQVILETSRKLVKLNKREVEPDDRDNLKYAKFLGLEDFIEENIRKDAGKLQNKAKMKIRQKKNLSWLQPGFFSPQVRSTIVGNPMMQTVSEGNCADGLDISHKISKLGPGGISSTQSIPDESRKLHPSSFGLIDPFRISESLDIGVTHRAARNVMKGSDNKLYRPMINTKTGKTEMVDHETLLSSKVGFPDE